MSQRLDPLRDEILELKARGFSIRAIAEKLSEGGERIAPSSVQYAVKQWSNGDGESKASSEVPESVLLGRLDSLDVSIGELKAALDELSRDSSHRERQIFRRTFLISLALAYLCVVIGGKITDSIVVRWLCYAWALFTLWELLARARQLMAEQLWKKQ